MLITIRHGQTNYNKIGLYSGVSDIPSLTDDAKKEAYKKGEILKKYNIDIAYISPLLRAKETFNEINKSLNISFVEDSNLVERNFKNYEAKEYSTFNYSICWNVEESKNVDIESIDSMVSRIEKVLNRIKKECPDKNVLIVGHSGVCRVIRYIIEGKKEKDLKIYQMENLHIDIYDNW